MALEECKVKSKDDIMVPSLITPLLSTHWDIKETVPERNLSANLSFKVTFGVHLNRALASLLLCNLTAPCKFHRFQDG